MPFSENAKIMLIICGLKPFFAPAIVLPVLDVTYLLKWL